MSFPQPFYRWRPHPWHGLSPGPDAPRQVLSYIELTPFDSVKYEVDKTTGYIKVDRPHRSSSLPPALYGFIPQSYCGPRVAALSPVAESGDKDPLDICVLSERPIGKSDIVLHATVVGGLQMVDDGEADDKIIAVLRNDHMWGEVRDISELPGVLTERLKHYFNTYKMQDGKPHNISIEAIYGYEHAAKVIEASLADYSDEFGG
ncbi:MAG: inorganic pyrophosphatase [Myxococcota bacterium]|nr:inorganic pyrophosphatase [Myxococcota bacterium]